MGYHKSRCIFMLAMSVTVYQVPVVMNLFMHAKRNITKSAVLQRDCGFCAHAWFWFIKARRWCPKVLHCV